jgi:hypothetical protein
LNKTSPVERIEINNKRNSSKPLSTGDGFGVRLIKK